MSLLARLTLISDTEPDPEDFLESSLGVIFPDDVANQHGDHNNSLLYTSPHLPRPLPLSLADPKGTEDRKLFSHYLWNSSLQLAELVEAATLGLGNLDDDEKQERGIASPCCDFNVRGLSTIELGAGTALPSIMSALLGAKRVAVTDYPAPEILETLRRNVSTLAQPQFSPMGRVVALGQEEETGSDGGGVEVHGHGWGEFPGAWEQENQHAFDRVFAADCLWMPWQHENLRTSIDWFMGTGPEARAWVVAGFHTGRDNMRGFFETDGLRRHGLVVDRIWERDCNGVDREWSWEREKEDISERKRWLVIACLRRDLAN
ncbi:nicotinamide N-methyltransferase [Rhypophila sp. PSN 637]